jgi:hypothetical protein
MIFLLVNKHFDIPELFYDTYYSNKEGRKSILTKFKNSTRGILSVVYCLGEGWDFPKLDGVVFCDNVTSNIRIVQFALRPNRKNPNESEKKAKIIIPCLVDDFLDDKTRKFDQVRKIVMEMGLEDIDNYQKLQLFRVEQDLKFARGDKLHSITYLNVEDVSEEYEELRNDLRLKTMNRSQLGITYSKAILINRANNIKTKEEYYELCERDNRLYLNVELYGPLFNWFIFLSIERTFYDLETCKKKVVEWLDKVPELKKHINLDLNFVCKELSKLDEMFPPFLWVEYYKEEGVSILGDIIKNTRKKKLVMP